MNGLIKGRRVMQKFFITFAAIVVINCVFNPVFARTATLEGVTVSAQNHEWHFLLHLSQPTTYRGFFLQHPLRYVVDLKNTRSNMDFQYNPLIGTPVKSVRYCAHPDHIYRLVFDLSCSADAHLAPVQSHGVGRDLKVVFTRKKNEIGSFSWPFGRHVNAKSSSKNETAVDQKKKSSRIDASHARDRDIVVVIDPGHGGKDPGATGRDGTHEKNVVLGISKYLYRMLNKQTGFRAVLTRNADYYLKLRQRLRIARKDRADMFVAIHADAWKNRDAHGVSIFALSRRGATSEAARWLAVRENKSELMGGVDLQDKSSLLRSVLINLSQVATIRSSLAIGESVMGAVSKIATMHHKKIEQAAFVVLKSPDIPSLLVETGFISNLREERLLRSANYQQQLAHAIMLGIKSYFVHHPPRNTYLYVRKYHPGINQAVKYTVQKGDSLSRIAAHFGVSIEHLMQWNHLHKTALAVGERLIVQR